MILNRIPLASGICSILVIGCSTKAPPPKAPVLPVSVATATTADVPLMVDATGSVEAIRTVTVQAQISGLLTNVAFHEGQDVVAGQTLFEIDPRSYQATLQQMQANLARDVAQWQIAQRDVERFNALAAKEYVTQQQLDQARTTAASLTATLRADSAAIDHARLDLQYATIKSPISGQTGAILLREGNLVRAGGEPLVVINQLSPVLVRFAVPAIYLDMVRRRAGASLPVKATPANVADSTAVQSGVLNFVDNAVDSNTGTLTLKAEFANTKRTLWPGALVRVTLELDTEKGAVVVPRSAVQNGQNGDMIWVMDSGTVSPRKVVVKRTTDSLALISSGVKAGEQVITDGQLRLTAGAKVQVRDTSAPDSTAGNARGGRGRAGGEKKP